MPHGREFGFIKEDAAITTTVHPVQIVDGDLPETDHDFRVGVIATPRGIISTRREGGRERNYQEPSDGRKNFQYPWPKRNPVPRSR